MNSWALGGIIYIYILYRVGDRTEPCGTPAYISLGVDISPSTETLNFLFERKELLSLIIPAENSNFDHLYSRPRCQVVSKAFSIPKNTATVDMLSLKFKVTWSVSLMH
jgi:adenine-specific DNA methylase